jgi:hypothetical protein
LPPATAPRQSGFDLGQAIKFVFEDPNWIRKVLIGGVFTLASMFVIGGIFVAGYMIRLIRRQAAGERHPLPEWDDLGAIFSEGLPVFGIYFLHAFGLMLIPALVGGSAVALGVMMSAGGRGSSDVGGAIAGLGITGAYLLMFVCMLTIMFYLPAAVARYAVYGKFAAAFQWRDNIDFIRRNMGNYVMAVVTFLVANMVSQFGFLLCCVGLFVTAFWANCVLGWSIGEVIRRDPAGLAVRSGI